MSVSLEIILFPEQAFISLEADLKCTGPIACGRHWLQNPQLTRHNLRKVRAMPATTVSEAKTVPGHVVSVKDGQTCKEISKKWFSHNG